MNRKILKSRYIQVIFFVVILMLILCVRLFVLTVVQEEKWAEAAKNQNTKEVLLSAPRGKIYDRYGRVLAGNKQIFTVTFNASGLSTEQINASAYRTIRLLEKNGDTYVDNFPIKITKSGKFYYTYDSSKKKWLKSLGLSKNATAEQAFEKLRAKYEIDPTLDRFDAMDELQNTHGVWPPINVRSMTFTYDTKKAAFISKYGLEVKETDAEGNVTKRTDLTAKEAFQALRKKYKLDEDENKQPIPEEERLSDKEARKIFVVREEIKNIEFNKYRSSTIASDVCDKTVAYIEEMGSELKGMEIASETVRVYPNKNLASHILGYMGSISDSQYDTYVKERGYSSDDLIGKDGIEASMESTLRGSDGIRTILVNSSGDYIETLGETEPVAGKDIYLTIDKDLQKTAENTLERAIKAVRTGSIFKSKYGNKSMRKYANC